MANPQRGTFWGSMSVWKKLATIPAIFILAICGILLYTIRSIKNQRDDTVVINMSDRQRTLNQRQIKEVILASQGLGGEFADYMKTRKLLNDTLEGLINGGDVAFNTYTNETRSLPAASADTDKIKFRSMLEKQRSKLDDFSTKADDFLKLKPGDHEYSSELITLLKLSADLDPIMNDADKEFIKYSQLKTDGMLTLQIVIGICVALIGIIASYLISRAIINPLKGVVSLAQDIATGNLRGEKLADSSSDEIGQLASVFNQMLDSLRDLAGQTRAVSGNLNAASAEILASTQEQAAGTKEQAATIQEITTTMEEARQSGAQVSERAKQVATAAEATSASTVSGLRTVQDTNRTMEAIREQVEEVAENIVALSEKTQAVGEIIATVNDIAERSNLLALNAAIEAASAGEQGNRFAVVANEMKNLADQAKESTVRVRTLLSDIQKGINSSVMLTEEAVKRAETGKQQADVTEKTIRQMTETTQESVQAFQQIIGATNQQQIGFDQVTQGMQDIRQAAMQTAVGTLQLERAVASLNAQSHQLREAVERYQI